LRDFDRLQSRSAGSNDAPCGGKLDSIFEISLRQNFCGLDFAVCPNDDDRFDAKDPQVSLRDAFKQDDPQHLIVILSAVKLGRRICLAQQTLLPG
jgi:hypothetical protein